MNNIIKAENVKFSYSDDTDQSQVVLNGVNIDIEKGKFIAVLGHNGSGKSTLAKHFNSVLVPTEGKVFVYDMDTADDDKVYDIRQKVGMVFQNPDNQIVATIVEEDVAFALENLGVAPAEIRERVDNALKSVNMYEFKNHSPHQLSGGQKQRIAIAGIIAMRPDCVVLDEPTAMLDPRGRKEVINTIRQLNSEFNIAVVLITHYMDEAAKADRVVVIDGGKVLLDGTPKQVFANVETLKKVGLDVPQATELAFMLKNAGIDIKTDVLNKYEAIDELQRLLEVAR
ncbi:MAG: energy-coupling factor transporter ATPase [Oscillospiraceae bacterium]|nr:energy-coupling factor transporter ATPase [Oscillospiraceae bacterium]